MTEIDILKIELEAEAKRKPFAVRVTPMKGEPYTADRFKTFVEARDYCRHKISYSGDRVQRVEIALPCSGARAMWDRDWDAPSKHAGLWT